MRNVALILCVPMLAACGAAPQEEHPLQATAAIMMQVRPGMPLDEMLQVLDEHLANAAAGRLEGDAAAEFRRAEAITDRLLEARMPFEWIANQQYSLESRLRQIQSLADRVLAMHETGQPRDAVFAELELLRSEVTRVRETVAQGGTRAPPSLERLLQGGDTAGTGARREYQAEQAAPAQPRGPRPIGTPVPPGGG